MPRSYRHIQEYEKEIMELREQEKGDCPQNVQIVQKGDCPQNVQNSREKLEKNFIAYIVDLKINMLYNKEKTFFKGVD